MPHSHSHPGAGTTEELEAPPRARRLLAFVLAPALLATVVGLLVLWPSGPLAVPDAALGFDAELVDGTVEAVEVVPCANTDPADGIICQANQVRLTSGPDEGDTVNLEMSESAASVELKAGDRIVLSRSPTAPPELAYQFADYQRRVPMVLLGLVFAVAVIGLGRWRGLAALAGLGLSLLVLVKFVLPAILDGRNALAVAIVGSAAIMFVALYLAHGFNAGTSTAVLGTLTSLAVTGLLAVVFVRATRLTGLADESAVFLQLSAEQVNLRGLLLGGMIIGSLGVLDDVTVTQVSAVAELHRANPSLGLAGLYRSGLRIGRDHIASTVNTLVLAYSGAALPLLLLFVQVERGLGAVLNFEVVAVEVVRTLVGSIGLVASVPITTALAAWVVTSGDGRPARPASDPR